MSDLTAVPSNKKMLSTEIAALCEKRHDHVMRDIDVIIKQLETSPDLGTSIEAAFYKDSYGRNQKCYSLDYEATMIVMTGYDVVARTKVIKRWMELEAKVIEAPKTLSQLEILSQSIAVLTEHDQRIKATEVKVIDTQENVKRVEAKVAQISVDLRNGVPHGFISRKNAKKIYTKGLSQSIFEEVMEALQVPTQKYVSLGEGYSTPTFAYQEDHIPTAIAHFLRDLEQVSPCQCFSHVLNKRVNYIKVLNYGLKELKAKEATAAGV